ncbi:MAG: ferrochelatase [Pseudomonadota bacterium]|nr:ferrochelatase [Pseudomonadota bacterium]
MSETGVLVANLGTPDAPTPAAVRRFLAEFLWDRRVVDLPRLPWWLILNGFVLPLRPRRSARAYREIWTDAGSPLMTGTQAVVTALGRRLQALVSPVPAIAMGMTYGNPSIAAALEPLRAAGTRHLVVLPLYPQYSRTTTASVMDRVQAAIARWPTPPELSVIEDYHAEPDHIAAIAGSVAARGKWISAEQHLLFSFHGIPRRNADAGDPYGAQCEATARLVADRLALSPAQWSIAFQSRVGGARWLEPYTEERLAALGRAGVRKLSVICPGFSVDCLETLEEIAIRGRATFIDAGGHHFDYIPALNDDPAQIDCFARLIAARVKAGRRP